MSRPFDIQVISEVESKLELFSHQLINNGAVVNAPDRSTPALALIKQFVAAFLDVSNRNRRNTEQFFGQQKIWQCLLLRGINLHQNYILRVLIANNRTPQKLFKSFPIQSTQQILQIFVEFENLHVRLREHGLIRI